MNTTTKIKHLVSKIERAKKEVTAAKSELREEQDALVREVARYLLKTQSDFNYHSGYHQHPSVQIIPAGQKVILEDYCFANPERRDFIAKEDYVIYSWEQPFHWETDTYAIAFPLRLMDS